MGKWEERGEGEGERELMKMEVRGEEGLKRCERKGDQWEEQLGEGERGQRKRSEKESGSQR